jgi:osmoprotectant transport system substrate-binding protein
VREQALVQYPALREALAELAGKITGQDMRRLNYAVDGEHRDLRELVAQFLREKKL